MKVNVILMCFNKRDLESLTFYWFTAMVDSVYWIDEMLASGGSLNHRLLEIV